MPTYSYRCASCDFAFDQYQAFTDDSLTICPNCGQPQLRKVFNDIGVSFKGSGFYRTDSRAKQAGSKPNQHKPGAEKSGSEKSGPDKTGSSSSGSGDSSAKPKSDKTPAAKPAASSASGSSGKSGSTSS